VDSYQLPVLSGRNRLEIVEKIRKSSGWNTASKIRRKFIGFGRFPLYIFDLGGCIQTFACPKIRKNDFSDGFRVLGGTESQGMETLTLLFSTSLKLLLTV
jgi:hypothetical protein